MATSNFEVLGKAQVQIRAMEAELERVRADRNRLIEAGEHMSGYLGARMSLRMSDAKDVWDDTVKVARENTP